MAREPIKESERRSVQAGACEIMVLAALDVIEAPGRLGATAQAVRDLLRPATAGQVAVLVESLSAREAHAVIEALGRAAMIGPGVAQVAHARIDLRRTPAPVGGNLTGA